MQVITRKFGSCAFAASVVAALPLAALAAPQAHAARPVGAAAHAGHRTVQKAKRPAYTVKTVHVTTHVGPHHSETCDVVGDLYRPAGATRRHRDPAVLTTNGFGGSKADQTQFGEELASKGYVVLSYSGLGFGGSGCDITLDDPTYDGMAGSELIDFLGGTRAATDGTRVHYVKRDRRGPIVGMIGGSYGGGIQFATVAADVARHGHSRVRAIIPIITWNDLNYSLAPNNAGLTGSAVTKPGAPIGVEKLQWDTALFAAGVASGGEAGNVSTCPGYTPTFCVPATRLAAQGYPDAELQKVLEHASVHSYVHRIHVPTMLMQGEHDSLFNLHESIATYRQLRAQHTPTKLVWQSWGHSNATPAPGELGVIDKQFALNEPSGALSFEGKLVEQWFAHYLKGSRKAPSLDFSFYRDWAQHGTSPRSAARAYGRMKSYPAGRSSVLHLSGAGSLVPGRTKVAAGSQSFTTPPAGAPAGVGEYAVNGQVPVTDVPGTFARFETAPLARPTQVVGIPSIRVDVDAPVAAAGAVGPAAQTVLIAKLEDIAPDGSVTVPGGNVSAMRLAGSGSVTVSLAGLVHQFGKGHRIALVITSSDSDYRGSTLTQPITVTTSPSAPGVLRLPVARPHSYGKVVYARAHHRR